MFSIRQLSLLLILLLSPPTWAQSTPHELLAKARQLSDSYNWTDAGPYFAASEQGFIATGDIHNALHAKVGRIRSTMEQLNLPQASAELATELENPTVASDPYLKMFVLIVKGDIDNELNSPGMAKDDWQQVLQLAENLGDTRWQYRSKGELSISAFMQGQVAEARKLVTEALMAAVNAKDLGAQLRFFTHIGTGLVILKSYGDGLPYLERALALASAHPETGYPFLANQGKVQALSGLERYDDAERLASEILTNARSKQRHVKEAQVLITLAKIARRRGEDSRARDLLQQSVNLSATGGFERLLAEAQSELAEIALVGGDINRAETLAQQAALHTRSGGEMYLIPERLRMLAQLKALSGKFAEANELYDEAADVVDIMLVNCPTASLKAMLITAMSHIYTDHFALLADHIGDVPGAHRVLERARGRSTSDLLQTGVPGHSAIAKDSDRRISALHLRLSRARTKREISDIRDQIFLAQQKKWLAVHPTTPKLPELVSLEEVRKHLGSDELILEFVWSEPKSYWLVISPQSQRVVPLSGESKLRPLVDGFLSSIKRRESARPEARKLYEALFDSLPDLSSKIRLTIVPDGPLHLVPFDALVNTKGRSLVQSHIITIASSSSTDIYLRKASVGQATDTTPKLLGVGGLPYDRSNTRFALTRGYGDGELGNLPSSRDEVMAAAAAFQSKSNTLLLGSAGTEHAFKRATASRQRIVHLAVHGVANREHPDRAGLLFLSDQPASEDGVLYPHEIVQLPLSADLVVLSACDTAVGRLQGQEGVANLSRAFLLAGAKTVVSTLWSIDDTFSLYLMKRFYEHLSAGRARADALVQAKRDMIQKFGPTAIPYYWAGFVMEGSGRRPLLSR